MRIIELVAQFDGDTWEAVRLITQIGPTSYLN
jgi:hypothetical protein